MIGEVNVDSDSDHSLSCLFLLQGYLKNDFYILFPPKNSNTALISKTVQLMFLGYISVVSGDSIVYVLHHSAL